MRVKFIPHHPFAMFEFCTIYIYHFHKRNKPLHLSDPQGIYFHIDWLIGLTLNRGRQAEKG